MAGLEGSVLAELCCWVLPVHGPKLISGFEVQHCARQSRQASLWQALASATAKGLQRLLAGGHGLAVYNTAEAAAAVVCRAGTLALPAAAQGTLLQSLHACSVLTFPKPSDHR